MKELTLEQMNKMKWEVMTIDDIMGFEEDYRGLDEKSKKHLKEIRKSVRDLLYLARQFRSEAYVLGMLGGEYISFTPNWKRLGKKSMEECINEVVSYVKKTFPMSHNEEDYSTTFTDGWGNIL